MIVKHKLLFISIIMIFLVAICVNAQEARKNSVKLLAVSELPDGEFKGTTADLTVEIIPGQGRVFLDTYPFSKLDTQISTRLAKEIACNFLSVDCSKYDFIYTIRSGSTIISGPSAGAAMSALTAATLDNATIDESVAISGTINSGGLVGPVGGLEHKIEAAKRAGIKTILIPKGERIVKPQERITQDNQTNVTIIENESSIDLIELGRSLDVTVIEVANLYDVMPILTNKEYIPIKGNITLPEFYVQTMQSLSENLCKRSNNLLKDLQTNIPLANSTIVIVNSSGVFSNTSNFVIPKSNIDVNSTYNTALELLNASKQALEEKKYYSAASFCYGAGVNLQFLTYAASPIKTAKQAATQALQDPDLNLSDYKTITDLQTYMLVEERITEAKNHIKKAREYELANQSTQAINSYVSAIERLHSAKTWSVFFKHEGTVYNLNNQVLKQSCQIRIQEAQERQNYVQLYIPIQPYLVEDLNEATAYQQNGDYVMCLFKASQAKASFDVVLGMLGVEKDAIQEHIAEKLKVAEQVIQRQTAKNIFPIAGYSYLEYAKSLSQKDPYSAALYIQYALELSDLDAYFESSVNSQTPSTTRMTFSKPEIFFLGFFAGIFLVILLLLMQKFVKKPISKKMRTSRSKFL